MTYFPLSNSLSFLLPLDGFLSLTFASTPAYSRSTSRAGPLLPLLLLVAVITATTSSASSPDLSLGPDDCGLRYLTPTLSSLGSRWFILGGESFVCKVKIVLDLVLGPCLLLRGEG
jgi:hypothetical protein